ncbi:MAG: hypothetical protein CMM96_02470 [Rickettsiales bacterium]|nr:hypothetical protein [Rickettsiales bacterium]
MRKYKLLYFVSEDKYFLTHKIDHILYAMKKNIEVLVICKKTLKKKNPLLNNVTIRYFDFDRKTLNPFKIILTIVRLYKIIKSYKPNIIHNTALKPILLGSAASLFFSNIYVINSIVGLGYIYINSNIKTKLLRILLNFPLKFFLSKKNFFTVFQNSDDETFFKLRCKINKSFLIRGSGVDIKKFYPENKKKIYDLVYHSRMLKDKGIIELINVIRKIKIKKSLKVLFLGNPDTSNDASISLQTLENWQNEGLIIWKGFCEEVIGYLNQSKISILPSYREGFPKSLLEGASCGLPIIATDVPGCREICVNNLNGFLVKPKDEYTLQKSIISLLNNKKLLKKFGFNSRKLVKQNFNVDFISRDFVRLYNQIIKESKKVQ